MDATFKDFSALAESRYAEVSPVEEGRA